MNLFAKPSLLIVSSLIVLVVLEGGATSEAAEYLVSDRATNRILRYDTGNGSLLGPLVDSNMATNGGLFLPSAMVFGFDGDLFVTSIDLNTGDGRVLRYDAGTGDFQGVFASGLLGPAGMLYDQRSDSLLVGSLGTGLGDSNVISRFARNGSPLTDIAAGPISGRTGMIIGPDERLYVSSFAEGPFFTGSVLAYRYNATTNDFQYEGPFAAAPQLVGANGLAWEPSGDLFVASLLGQSVIRFDIENGVAVSGAPIANIPYPSGLLLEGNENLLVTSLGNNNPNDPIYNELFPGSVFRVNRTTGEFVGQGPFLTGGAEFLPTAILRRVTAGDYNFDGLLTAFDIDSLTQALRGGAMDAKYDLDGNGLVNAMDRAVWVDQLKRTYFGDSNLDGEFSSGDLVVVFAAGEYEDASMANSTWATGDWNGDAEFGSGDLVTAFQSGGFEIGPRPATIVVPEPRTACLLLFGMLAWVQRRRGCSTIQT